MKRLYTLLLLSLLFIGCSDKHDDQPNSPAVQLYELHYTTIDEKVVELYRDDFGADIVSNTYNDGVGVIAFDAPITTIGERVFYNCSTLESITIPSSVTSIGSEAFYRCDCLKAFNGKYATPDGRALIIDETLCYIAPSGLTDYTIPSDVKTLGSLSFAYCTELVTVKIPSSVTAIGSEAFYACASIEGVTLPESVVSLGELSFAECDHLSEVYVQQSTPPTGGDDMFDGNAADRKIYVPVQSYTAYVSKEHWRDYADYIVGYDFDKGEIATPKPANNEIWYTSSDGNIVTPHRSNVFGATIVSNTYEDGKGVITFDGAVTTIGYKAFYDCSSLTSVTIGDSVTTIEDWAFSDCDSLTSVTIPDSVTTIGEYAFDSCVSLTSVTIPGSVTTIGRSAFASCDSLKEFKGKYATDNGRCLVVDNTLIAYANKSGTEYTIPDCVTTIGNYAFNRCGSLTSVTIPDSVTTIGDSAFNRCGSLTSVTIGDSVTTIGDCAFYDCSSLTSVTIGDSVTTIGDMAFYDCSSLTSVYCKATTPPSIGYNVFYDNANSRKIYVPTASVNDYKTAYGWRDYADYILGYDFEKGEVAPEGQLNNEIWYTSDDGQIIEPSRANVFGANVISNTYEDGKGVITFDGAVTTIGNDAFYFCKSLTSITIPDSVTTIGDRAFNSCYRLEEFKGKFSADNGRCLIVDNTLIAYANKSGTEYTIPDSVTTIGEYAFCWCVSLTSVTIPDSVTTIGDWAFDGCKSLTSVTIGDSVTTIGYMAFGYCDSLTSVTIGDSITKIGDEAFRYCISLTSVTIPDSVTTIGYQAFSDCDSLTSVTIGDSVTTIGYWAFMNCISLTSVTIGDSVTTIGREAFYSCRSLTSVYCKATTPPRIGIDVFNYNANSRKIYVPTASVNDYKTANGWRGYANYIVGYDFEKGEVAPEGQRNNEIWYTSSGGNIVTPYTSNVFGATIVSNTYENGKGIITFDGAVTTIGDSAFSGCDSLTSITIPDSVTTIGDWAFGYCYGLTSITIPDSVTTIGDYAFKECDSLTSVTIPDSVTTIGDGAFWDCTSLTSITIPDSVTTIGDDVFSCCNSLTSVTIGDSVTTIGDYAFYDCSSLTSVTIPDSVTTIGEWAFSDCNSLTSVTIPDSVTTIGDYAFWSCKSLTSVNIGDSVTTIGGYAFYKCASLTSVYCKATTPPSIGDYVFYYNANSRKIYVPTASVNDYKTADGWRDYANYIVGYDF